jgi:adenylate kinase
LGAKCKSYTDTGKLVPDELVSAMVRKRLAEPDAAKGWILDGYPRTVQQAKDLDGSQVRDLKWRNQRLSHSS